MREIRAALLVGCISAIAAPLSAQTIVNVENGNAGAEIVAGAGIEGPSRINQVPGCLDLSLPCETPPTAPDFAGVLSGALLPTTAVGIVGELSIASSPWFGYGTTCVPTSAGLPETCAVNRTNHPRAALAGVRVRSPLLEAGTTRWRLFGQLLAGPQWSDVGVRGIAWQPGVGADDYLRNGLILHVEYAYRVSPGQRRDLSTGRYLVGIGVPIAPKREVG